MNEELKEKIIDDINDIFGVSLLNVNQLRDIDIQHINCTIFYLYKKIKELISNYENEIINLECELHKIKKECNSLNKTSDNLANELLLAEIALNKLTNGHAKEEMDKVTLNDIFLKH